VINIGDKQTDSILIFNNVLQFSYVLIYMQIYINIYIHLFLLGNGWLYNSNEYTRNNRIIIGDVSYAISILPHQRRSVQTPQREQYQQTTEAEETV
jgi:hypothetical protein